MNLPRSILFPAESENLLAHQKRITGLKLDFASYSDERAIAAILIGQVILAVPLHYLGMAAGHIAVVWEGDLSLNAANMNPAGGHGVGVAHLTSVGNHFNNRHPDGSGSRPSAWPGNLHTAARAEHRANNEMLAAIYATNPGC